MINPTVSVRSIDSPQGRVNFLVVGSSVADAGYEGEVHINLHNIGNEDVKISAGEKIVQFLLLPVVCCGVEEVATVDELYANKNSTRGEGGFGSTGEK